MNSFVVLAVIASVFVLTESRAVRNKRWPSWLGGGDCKELGDDCDGVPKCCGDLICFWEDGLSLLGDGECVECIEEGEICQRDKSCCKPDRNACIKDTLYDVNGHCQEKLDIGTHCHHDDDCKSDNCEREYTLSLHGECAHK